MNGQPKKGVKVNMNLIATNSIAFPDMNFEPTNWKMKNEDLTLFRFFSYILILFFSLCLLQCDYFRSRFQRYTLHEVGWYDTPGSAYDIVISGNYAYVADSTSLRVLNIENPVSPYEIGYLFTGHIIRNISVVGNYAYLADYYGDLLIIDISNPAQPQQIGQIRPGTSFGVNDVLAEENYVYCTTPIGPYGLYIIDVSQPNNPQVIGRSGSPGRGEAWQIAKYGNYVYAVGYIGLRIFDISFPEAPEELNTVDLGLIHDYYGQFFKIAISKNFLYLSNGGLVIFNITNPGTPQKLGTFDTYGYVYGVAVQDSFVYLTNYTEPDKESLYVLSATNKSHPRRLTSINTRLPGFSIAVLEDYIFLATGKYGIKVFKLEKK